MISLYCNVKRKGVNLVVKENFMAFYLLRALKSQKYSDLPK